MVSNPVRAGAQLPVVAGVLICFNEVTYAGGRVTDNCRFSVGALPVFFTVTVPVNSMPV